MKLLNDFKTLYITEKQLLLENSDCHLFPTFQRVFFWFYASKIHATKCWEIVLEQLTKVEKESTTWKMFSWRRTWLTEGLNSYIIGLNIRGWRQIPNYLCSIISTVLENPWKSLILPFRAKRATLTFCTKVHYKCPIGQFGEILKTWSWRSNSATRQVTFNWTQIGGKCQNRKIQIRHFE